MPDMQAMISKVLDKVLSGRWLLTVTCAAVLAYGVYSKIMPSQTAVLVIVLVFEWYFKRDDRQPPAAGGVA